ncbi:MAG: hypothetical protein RIT24_1647 [Planctomycetota bacterium]|jgi:hypothetical protein
MLRTMMLAPAIARLTAACLSLSVVSPVLAGSPTQAQAPQQAPKPTAPKQGGSGQETPKPDVPKEPIAPVNPVQTPAKPAPIRVGDSIDPKAESIVKRGMRLVADLRTISMVTETRYEGDVATNLPPGFGSPHEVALEYIYKDALSLPRMRISPVSSNGVVVFTHNGTEGLVVDNGAKIYRKGRSDWPKVAPFAVSALPAWLIAERQGAVSQIKKAPDAELRPDMSAASILGVETLDGTECDVVRIVKYLDVYADDTGQGQPGVVDAKRVITDIAYARQDGFPRRIVRYEEGTGSTGRTTTEYTKVRVNTQLDPALFSATPPEGYTLAPPAPPAAAPAAPPAKQPTK